MNLEVVKDYYGKVLKTSEDLKTSACCDGGGVPSHLEALLANVHEEVRAKYYGCGLVVPAALSGARVLDLGSGSGRDVYLIAQLVGPEGEVAGVDMTDEQFDDCEYACRLAHAAIRLSPPQCQIPQRLYRRARRARTCRRRASTSIVSNCVINLSIDKLAVLRGAYDLLKPGGELYFADVYCDRRLPDHVRADPVLYGECLGGALYWNDFLPMAKQAGFLDPRLVTSRPIAVENAAMRAKLGQAQFFSATYRLFKLDGLETACEDYGQAVIYKGTVPEEPDAFALDGHHLIERGKVFPVCGNTWRMLADTRFAPHFDFIGDFATHYGIFPGCGTTLPFATNAAAPAKASGGCC